MTLVDREQHFARLEAALDEAGTGRSRIVLCSGPTGCGKTALLRAFADTARRRGVQVVEARASPLQRDMPLSVMRRLLDAAAPLAAAGRPRPGEDSPDPVRSSTHDAADDDAGPGQPAPDAGLPRVPDHPGPPSIEQRLGSMALPQELSEVWRRAAKLLGAISARGPVVLCVDDVQFADCPSLGMLLFLLHEELEKAALLVLAERESVSPPHPSILGEQAQNPGFERLAVRPLSVDAVKSLLRETADEPAADRMSVHFHGATGGNPLLVQGLLRDHAARTAGAGCPLFDSTLDRYQQAVQCCIAREEPVVRATAQALAILGPAGTPRNIAGLLGTAPAAVEAAMHTLESVGLTSGGALRQPRAVDAVLKAVPAEDRAALHLRSARLLYDEGAHDLAVAEHLRDSGRVQSPAQPCEPWIIRTLIRAARQAEEAQPYPAAIEYLNLARLASHGGPDDSQINRLLLRARWRDDPAVGLRQIADLADAARAAPHDVVTALSPVPYLLWFGRVEEAYALVRAWADSPAGARTGADPGDPVPIAELSRLCFACLYPGWAEKSSALLGRSPAGGSRMVPCSVRTGPAGAVPPDFISSLLSTEPADTAVPAAAAALVLQLYTGDLDTAAASCRLLLDHRAVRTSTMWRALLTAAQAEIALRAGDPDRAERAAAGALELVSAEGWGVVLAGPVSTRASALVGLGRLDEAERLLATPLPEATAQTVFGLHHRIAHGRFHAAAGQSRAALNDFTLAGRQMMAWKLDLPGLLAWRVEAAAAAALCHEAGLARELLQEQLAQLGEGHDALRALALRRLALISDLRHRPAMLREAAGLYLRLGDLAGQRAVRLDLDAALRVLDCAAQKLAPADRAGQPEPAQHHAGPLRQGNAPGQSHQPGHQPGPAAAHAHPAAQQPRKRGNKGLSRAERRVAALAAAGQTNRQIAGHLYLTVSTVEQHLTRIYRKLGVSNRAELNQLDVER